MNGDERIGRWLAELATTLDAAAVLAARGEAAYHDDPALPLAFEALSNMPTEAHSSSAVTASG